MLCNFIVTFAKCSAAYDVLVIENTIAFMRLLSYLTLTYTVLMCKTFFLSTMTLEQSNHLPQSQ